MLVDYPLVYNLECLPLRSKTNMIYNVSTSFPVEIPEVELESLGYLASGQEKYVFFKDENDVIYSRYENDMSFLTMIKEFNSDFFTRNKTSYYKNIFFSDILKNIYPIFNETEKKYKTLISDNKLFIKKHLENILKDCVIFKGNLYRKTYGPGYLLKNNEFINVINIYNVKDYDFLIIPYKDDIKNQINISNIMYGNYTFDSPYEWTKEDDIHQLNKFIKNLLNFSVNLSSLDKKKIAILSNLQNIVQENTDMDAILFNIIMFCKEFENIALNSHIYHYTIMIENFQKYYLNNRR
jgi:hypothetical protein